MEELLQINYDQTWPMYLYFFSIAPKWIFHWIQFNVDKSTRSKTFDKKEYSKYFGKSQNYKSPRVLELDIKELKTIMGKKRLIKLYLIFLYHMIRSVSQYRGIPLHLNFFFHFDIEMSIFTEYQFTNPSFRIWFIKVSNAFKYR